jgi:hypothetical protein
LPAPYSCALGPLLSKLRFSWTQTLQYYDSQSDNKYAVSHVQVANAAWVCWTKELFMSWEGQSGMIWNFIILSRMTNTKLFPEIPDSAWHLHGVRVHLSYYNKIL